MRSYLINSKNQPVRGFTLIELIMVIVILGVLAVVAVPRIFSSNDFYARGFHDETLALLRYAQKAAVAQRRTVCVAFASGSVTLTMAANPATVDCATAATLTGPNGSPTVTARSGVSFSGTPSNFNFNGLGQPMDASGAPVATQTIQITGAADVIVEAQTGYVHD
ncbi:MAG: hypothetical protein AUK51_10640 [Comamonadaceae bacterium CG2_30_59_20]|nr:MAG: hypothetical protein AUK51_10640 [Comamonadaceae bacterium CG2_30_59_20]